MSENKSAGSGAANQLILRVRQEESGAFEQLLSMYEPMISAAVRRYLPDGADEDDARQEALAGFYRAALSYDLEQSEVAFGFYAKVCVTNALISHTRDIARRARRAADIEYDEYMRHYGGTTPDPADVVAERESTEELQRLIKHRTTMHTADVSSRRAPSISAKS